MKILRVTSNGRITIPTKLRKKYNLKPGTRINFVEEKDGIKIIPLAKETIRTNAGFLKIKGKSLLKILMEEKKKECEL
jgi:AbrB family looped-hinge helix DNA binding protein